MSQVISQSFYTSAATSLQQTLGFDDWIAFVLMVTNDNSEVTNTQRIVVSNWCWLTEAPVS